MIDPIPGLRVATTGDIPAIARLINVAFSVESFLKQGDRTDEQQVREKMTTGTFYVVEAEGKLTACIYLEIEQPGNKRVLAQGAGAGYIGMLAVDPAQQGRGLGKRLMLFAEAELRGRGCTRAQLRTIDLRHELRTFYQNQGYRELGFSPYPFPEKTSQSVRFVNMEKTLK